MINQTFNKVNKLFVLLFENGYDRFSYLKHYTPTVEIKDYNVLIDSKSFFDIPIKIKEEAYEKIVEMSKNNDYSTGNLLDYEYSLKHYRLIAIDLNKQDLINKLILLEHLKEIMDQQCSLSLKNKKKPLLVFHKIL